MSPGFPETNRSGRRHNWRSRTSTSRRSYIKNGVYDGANRVEIPLCYDGVNRMEICYEGPTGWKFVTMGSTGWKSCSVMMGPIGWKSRSVTIAGTNRVEICYDEATGWCSVTMRPTGWKYVTMAVANRCGNPALLRWGQQSGNMLRWGHRVQISLCYDGATG